MIRIFILAFFFVGTSLGGMSFASTDTDIFMDQLAARFGLRPRPELPAIKKLDVKVSIQKNIILGKVVFSHSYSFKSDPMNTGECYSLRLFVDEADSISTKQFNSQFGFIDPRLNIVENENALVPIVAVELENKPADWIVRFMKGGGISWICGTDCKNKLLPGNTVDGFSIKSPGLPRLRRIEAAALQAIEQFYPPLDELSDTEADIVTQVAREDQLRNTRFLGKTLGPGLPPTNQAVICDTFILDLIDQVREAVAAGWIKHDLRKDDDDDDDHGKRKGDEKGKKKGHEKDDNGDEGGDGDDSDLNNADKNLPGVAKSIIKKLTNVRRECMRGKFGNAREKLRALIKQVNAQRGKHLTEEAYALIKFNAEFLLEKL